MIDTHKLIKTLNHLLVISIEGRRGYENAALHISDVALKNLFNELADQRNKFVYELHHTIKDLGGEPHEGHHLYASLHRGWMDLKSAFADGGEQAVLRECLRGDEVAMHQYLTALAEELGDVRPMIWDQYEQIKAAHGTIAARTRMPQPL